MATYKVIQDIEADDKLLGPLTLRQFVYAGIFGLCIYLCYFVASKGAALFIIFLIPPALVAAFFAFPWSREQPTELWALARIRFLFKPRKRVWDQSGMKELVTVTAPKKIEQIYTDGLTQTQVKNRLQALASTIDSRGWAVKGSVGYATAGAAANSDRLVDVDTMTQDASNDTEAYHDMFDTTDSQVAEKFDSMLTNTAQQHHQQLVTAMQQPDAAGTQTPQQAQQTQKPADYWFLNQGPGAQSQVVTPGASDDPYVRPANITREEEEALVEELKAHDTGPAREYSHLPTILPLSEQEKLAKEQAAVANEPNDASISGTPVADDSTDDKQQDGQKSTTMTEEPDAAILELARNDDLNVETIARQAKKAHGGDADEVVISLH